jgi:hypothetical protein
MRSTATVVEEDVLDIIARLEIQKSLRLQYPVSLLSICPKPTRETAGTSPLAFQLTRVVSSVVRATDVVGCTSPGTVVHVLLVDAHPNELSIIIRRIRDEVGRHRFAIEGDRVTVGLAIGTASFPANASRLSEMRSQADTQAAAVLSANGVEPDAGPDRES